MAKPKTTIKVLLPEYTVPSSQIHVKVGDTVLMRVEDPGKPLYVAKIEQIESNTRTKQVKVRCRWYYRPEESKGGRRQFHGAKELFFSDHYDTQRVETIEGTCAVHSMDDYEKLDHVSAEDFFTRFDYVAGTGALIPDQIAVYCKCEMPYNPDDLMIQCKACRDWFHPTCLRMSDSDQETAIATEDFFCPDCGVYKIAARDKQPCGQMLPPRGLPASQGHVLPPGSLPAASGTNSRTA